MRRTVGQDPLWRAWARCLMAMGRSKVAQADLAHARAVARTDLAAMKARREIEGEA